MAARFLSWRRRGLPLLLRQTRCAALLRILYAGRSRRLRRSLPLQSWRRLLSGLLLLQSGRTLLQAVLFLQPRLPLLSRLTLLWAALLPQRALLLHDPAAGALRGMNLPYDSLIARDLLRRDLQGYRAETSPRAAANRKTRRGLRQQTELSAVAAPDVDASDLSVLIGIKFDPDIVWIGRRCAFRHFNQSRGAANSERRGWRRDFHVAGLSDCGCDERNCAARNVENGCVVFCAVFIDKFVDDDA